MSNKTGSTAGQRSASWWVRAPAVAALVVAVAGCGATATSGGSAPASSPSDRAEQTAHEPASTQTPDVNSARMAAVYITALQRYLGTELSVGGADDVGTVYILTRAGGDQGSAGEAVARIQPQVQRAVSAALGDQYRIRWVDDDSSVQLSGRACDPAGKRDVLVTLGRVPAGDQIRLTLDGRSDCGLAGGWVYQLSAEDGSWTVTGRRASWQT